MNTSPITQALSSPAECDLLVWARRIGIAMFAVTVAALESWLQFPIQPLFDGYLQSSMSRVSSVIASVFHHSSY
jgi:hypothetical protein